MQQGEADDFAGGPEGVAGDPEELADDRDLLAGDRDELAGDPEELAGDPDLLASDAGGPADRSEEPPGVPDDFAGEAVAPDDFVGDVADITQEVPGDAGPALIGAAGEEPDWHESGGLRPSTGEPRVDAALARLDDLAGRPVTEHRAVFEDVHRRLRDVLGELDSRQPPGDGSDAAGRPGR